MASMRGLMACARSKNVVMKDMISSFTPSRSMRARRDINLGAGQKVGFASCFILMEEGCHYKKTYYGQRGEVK